MIQSVSAAPTVMAAAALKRSRVSRAKKSADTHAAPENTSKSKLSSMRSPFQGSKRRKVPDPLQEQIDLIHGGWKPSEPIEAIPKALMKSPPAQALGEYDIQSGKENNVFPRTPQNTSENNPTSPSTPLTPTPIIAKKTQQMSERVGTINTNPAIPAPDNRKISARWARQNANKGYHSSARQTKPKFDPTVINSSRGSSMEAGALLNVSKGDGKTYEALCDYNNQLASDSARVHAIDEVFQHIREARGGQNADFPDVEEIMKQLSTDVFATKNERQGRLKIYWESKS